MANEMRRHFAQTVGLRVGRRGKHIIGRGKQHFVGQLEDNVPMPTSRNYAGLRRRMEGMKPGQSFVTNASRSGVYAMAKKLGFHVQCRPTSPGQIRVWRMLPDEEE